VLSTLLQWRASLPPWAAEFWRYANGLLLLALLFVPLERRFGRRRQATLRTGWAIDVTWYFLTSMLPSRLLALPVGAMLWALSGVAPHGLWPALGELPALPRFALAIGLAEVGFYWGHRAMHASALLWRFHAIHHSAPELDWLVNTRAHPVDWMFVRLCGLLPLYALGLAQPQRGEPDWVPLLVTLVGSLWGYLIHANLRWRFGALEHLVATPVFHHWHHQDLGPGGRRHTNYAAFLPVLDRVFGTLHLPHEGWPERYGTGEPPLPTLVDQLLGPFMGAARGPSGGAR
jgi:sterol desaturase/sphingolipid hydroxylase (fatty acid hydroxylase superfamily)